VLCTFFVVVLQEQELEEMEQGQQQLWVWLSPQEEGVGFDSAPS